MKSRRLIALGEAWSLSKSLILGELSLFDLLAAPWKKLFTGLVIIIIFFLSDSVITQWEKLPFSGHLLIIIDICLTPQLRKAILPIEGNKRLTKKRIKKKSGV